MKRLGVVLLGSLTTVALTASVALAQYPPSKPPATEPDGPPPVAFTGANISLGIVILIALVVVGTVLLLATRRRRVVSPK